MKGNGMLECFAGFLATCLDVYLHSQLGAISHPAGVHLFKIKNNGMIHHEHDISMDANGAYF